MKKFKLNLLLVCFVKFISNESLYAYEFYEAEIYISSVSDTGETCSSPHWIDSLPFSYSGTTAGFVNDYDSVFTSCHNAILNGEDYVFAYTPLNNECISIQFSGSGDGAGFCIFDSCPSLSSDCISCGEFVNGIGVINGIILSAGHTYYLIIDNNPVNGNFNVPFNISVTGGGTPPSNDDCINATSLGTIQQGVVCTPQTFSTLCSTPTALGEAGAPACVPFFPFDFIDGVTGDVWLRFTANYTGGLGIYFFQAAANTTSDASMAVYTGSCGSMVVPYACDYNSGPNGMPYSIISVLNGTTYYIRVWTDQTAIAGNFDICFDTDSLFTNLINTTENRNTLNLYPNPFRNIISVNTESSICNIFIFDFLGKKYSEVYLENSNVNNYELNFNSLSTGIYLIQVNTKENTYLRKIMKE